MASKTTVSNMALSHIGVGHEISDLDTERSEEANAIKTFYLTAVEFMQSDFVWPFLTRTANLGLVEEDPTTEWDYSYRYPADCIKIHRIYSPLRNDYRQSRIPYLIYSDDTGKLVYTDCEDAVIDYAKPVLAEDKWPADFVLAFSYLLGSYIAPRLTKGDPFKMREIVLALYSQYRQLAEQRAVNEEQAEEVPASEFVRARESDVSPFPDSWSS